MYNPPDHPPRRQKPRGLPPLAWVTLATVGSLIVLVWLIWDLTGKR